MNGSSYGISKSEAMVLEGDFTVPKKIFLQLGYHWEHGDSLIVNGNLTVEVG